MAEFQGSDNQVGPILQWVKDGKFPSKSILYRIKSKATRKLFYQLDRLVLKQGVLHRLYINEDMEYHQLVLPQRLQGRVLRSVQRTLELLRERVYWPTMTNDAAQWVSRCTHCQVAQGTYTDPKPKIGQLESNNPLDLLCLDFTKVDPSKTGKKMY